MSGQDNKLREFKRELAELLNKYDAYIGVNVFGDTHNLDYEFYVELGEGKDENGWRIGFEHKLRGDCEIGARHLD